MGKRSTKWSYKTYLRFLRNGRGVGDLACYKPWITIHDFPSKGKVVRILGKKRMDRMSNKEVAEAMIKVRTN
jgi:hypothetical protein